MAGGPLSEAAQSRIDAVLAARDPGGHPRLERYRGILSSEDWEFVVAYVRSELRSCLELGEMVRALIDSAEERGHATTSVCEGLRRHQGLRSRNFGIADDLDARFMKIALSPGSVGLVSDLECLRQEVEDDMFGRTKMQLANPPPLGKRAVLDVLP